MKKTNKNNDNKKIIITLFAVALIIAIIGGATFAYWSWTTNTAQRTNITITVPDVDEVYLNIVGNNITNTGMYPTADCDGAGALIGEVATVTAVNGTESDMTVYLALRATVTAKQGSLNTTNKGKLNWAVVDTTAGTTCETTPYKGTLANATTNTDIPILNTAATPSALTFTATKNTTTTKTYRVYVWLDSSYEFTNTGNNITDPMQNLTISVQWSQASKMVQDTGYTTSDFVTDLS